MSTRTPSFESGESTRCVHAGAAPDPATGAIASPIHLSTTFERDADGGYRRGYKYSREGTPNRDALEACVAELEGGSAAFAFGSGLAATLAVFELVAPGERIVAPVHGYYGALEQLRTIIAGRGIAVDFIDMSDPAAVAAAFEKPARLAWIETPANPVMGITDIADVVARAHRAGALVGCDNTFATPICQRPLELGADIVMHSATKYLGGHSDVLGGIVVVGDRPELVTRLRTWQALSGGVLAPFDCWLVRRSISTLALRVRAQCANAATLAARLETHPAIERVLYPGLASHPGHAIARRQMPGGYGAMLSILVRGDAAHAIAVAARTELFRRATSLGAVESLIEHRASIEGPSSPTPKNLLRLSVGIEDADDLWRDLVRALG